MASRRGWFARPSRLIAAVAGARVAQRLARAHPEVRKAFVERRRQEAIRRARQAAREAAAIEARKPPSPYVSKALGAGVLDALLSGQAYEPPEAWAALFRPSGPEIDYDGYARQRLSGGGDVVFPELPPGCEFTAELRIMNAATGGEVLVEHTGDGVRLTGGDVPSMGAVEIA